MISKRQVFISPLNRREILAKSLLEGSALCNAENALAFKNSRQNAIVLENLKPGNLDWQLTYTRTDSKDKWRCPIIEDFAFRSRVPIGETITFLSVL